MLVLFPSAVASPHPMPGPFPMLDFDSLRSLLQSQPELQEYWKVSRYAFCVLYQLTKPEIESKQAIRYLIGSAKHSERAVDVASFQQAYNKTVNDVVLWREPVAPPTFPQCLYVNDEMSLGTVDSALGVVLVHVLEAFAPGPDNVCMALGRCLSL